MYRKLLFRAKTKEDISILLQYICILLTRGCISVMQQVWIKQHPVISYFFSSKIDVWQGSICIKNQCRLNLPRAKVRCKQFSLLQRCKRFWVKLLVGGKLTCKFLILQFCDIPIKIYHNDWDKENGKSLIYSPTPKINVFFFF